RMLAQLAKPLAGPPMTTPVEQQSFVLPDLGRIPVLFLVNLSWLFGTIYLLVSSLEKSESFLYKWRSLLYVLPPLACVPVLILTLVRGQVELMLLFLIGGYAVALVRERRFAAGLCLAGAICVKIIPAFLLILPLWQRDRPCLLGVAVGLAVGLGLIPALAIGPVRTAELYAKEWQVLLAPGLGLGEDTSRAEELLNAGATVNLSFQMVLH